jgi:uncharacterized membrane protein
LGAIFLLTSLGLSWIKTSGDVGDVAGAAAAVRQENPAGAVDWWTAGEASPADDAEALGPGVPPGADAPSSTPR